MEELGHLKKVISNLCKVLRIWGMKELFLIFNNKKNKEQREKKNTMNKEEMQSLILKN